MIRLLWSLVVCVLYAVLSLWAADLANALTLAFIAALILPVLWGITGSPDRKRLP